MRWGHRIYVLNLGTYDADGVNFFVRAGESVKNGLFVCI